jgi:hypothetical protein
VDTEIVAYLIRNNEWKRRLEIPAQIVGQSEDGIVAVGI